MVQKPEQYRDRKRRRYLKSFAYSVGLWQKSCKKTSLHHNKMARISRRPDLHPFPMHFLMGTHCFPFHSHDLKVKFGSRQRKQFYRLQIGTGNLSLGSDIFWVWGPNMDKIYFLEHLQFSYQEDLLFHLRKNLQDSKRARHHIKPWGRWDKKMYPLKHIGDKLVSSLLRDCETINQSGRKWEYHHSF